MDLFRGPVLISFTAEEGEPAFRYDERFWLGVDGGFLHVYDSSEPSFDNLVAFYNMNCIRSIERD